MAEEKDTHKNVNGNEPANSDDIAKNVSNKENDTSNEPANNTVAQQVTVTPSPDQPATPGNQASKPLAAHHRKKWNDYIFDFLMVFFAITLGFFVDNRREYYMEGQREKAYMMSLYDDLKIDTAIINRTYNEKLWAHKKLDSLCTILTFADLTPYNEMIYYFERFLTQTDVFTSQDVTYQQLRSSGNFRYIENIALYKKIVDYYNLYNRYQQLAESSFGTIQALTEMETKLFNGNDLKSLNNINAETFYNLFNRPAKKLDSIKADTQALNFLSIKAANAIYSIMACERFLAWLKIYAANLMLDLKAEYHLKVQ